MLKAKLIGETGIRGTIKQRWECPKCRANKDQPECRFNLSADKYGKTHKCRFCGTELLLEK